MVWFGIIVSRYNVSISIAVPRTEAFAAADHVVDFCSLKRPLSWSEHSSRVWFEPQPLLIEETVLSNMYVLFSRLSRLGITGLFLVLS